MTFKDWIWPLIAFSSYIVGGFLTFGGVALILFMRGEDFMGLGEGHSYGYSLSNDQKSALKQSFPLR